KAFPIQEDDHFYTVMRYVERNALRAALVSKAATWRWGSLYQRVQRGPLASLLASWPVPMPRDWPARVERAETQAELEAIRVAIEKSQPFGSQTWRQRTAKKLGLEYTFRRRGRPRKRADK